MQRALWKPLSVGRIIDRGFQLYRTYFGKLLMIMLMTYGPFYLIGELLKGSGVKRAKAAVLGTAAAGGSFQTWLEDLSLRNSGSYAGWHGVVYFAVLFPIGVFFLFPVAMGAVVSLVRYVIRGEEVPAAWELVRGTQKRIWRMALSSFLFSLILIGIYGVAVGGIVGMAFGLFSGRRGGAGVFGGSNVGLMVVLMILLFFLVIAAIVAVIWLMVRLGYYLPYVALGEESIGLRRSWRLTKRNFWRMLLMWFIVSSILYMITVMLQGVVMVFLGGSVIGKLLQAIVSMLITPVYLLPYAVSYFDLRARNEGYGLEELIRRTVTKPDPEPAVEEWQPRYE